MIIAVRESIVSLERSGFIFGLRILLFDLAISQLL
jgi:hypothetical protein